MVTETTQARMPMTMRADLGVDMVLKDVYVALFADRLCVLEGSVVIRRPEKLLLADARDRETFFAESRYAEFEKEKLIAQYKDKVHDIISATVQKVEPATGNAVLLVDKNEIYLYKNEQIPGEVLTEGDIIKIYVVGIVNPDRKPAIKISRTHKDLVKRLFELEIPEIYDGVVEIKSIAREAGSRTKIAVCSKDPNVDCVGACIGPKRSRISKIVEELGGEKIDIIVYDEDPAVFIAKALAPADVIRVDVAEGDEKACTVIVPNNQLSLAIGNKGQNAKLAARLTGYKIDIKPENPVD